MTVTNVEQDRDALTLTLRADFAAAPDRVWDLWQDPRKLERWWGPPGYPATFTEHDLTAGSRTAYFMTSPEGERFHGAWLITAAEPPRHLRFDDAFADEHGQVNAELPVSRVDVRLEDAAPERSTMVIVTTFPSAEAMDQVVSMGMVEGLTQAVGQMDALLG